MPEIVVALPMELLSLWDSGGEWPPFFDHVVNLLREKKPVIYAWGDRIYNPEGGAISAALYAHEQVHCERQAGDPATWWRHYITEPAFRLQEEVPAHRVEFGVFCQGHKDRNARSIELHRLALRLSSPLYGSLIDYAHAKHAITGAVETAGPGWREQAAAAKVPRFRARIEDATSE